MYTHNVSSAGRREKDLSPSVVSWLPSRCLKEIQSVKSVLFTLRFIMHCHSIYYTVAHPMIPVTTASYLVYCKTQGLLCKTCLETKLLNTNYCYKHAGLACIHEYICTLEHNCQLSFDITQYKELKLHLRPKLLKHHPFLLFPHYNTSMYKAVVCVPILSLLYITSIH